MDKKYLDIARNTEEQVLKFAANSSWKSLKSTSGVDIHFMKSPHFNGNMYKFSCVIEAPPAVVYEVLKPPANAAERMAWDKSISNYERVVTFNEELSISAISSPSVMMGMVSAREFLDLFQYKTITGMEIKHWVFAESIDYDQHPPKTGIIRAHTYPSGYSAQPVNGGKDSRVEFFINIDPCGMIPRSLVETALPSQQVKYIDNLKAEVARRMNQST